MGHRIVIIAGPTASGKSAHALGVAQSRGGVIINADSQQMFRDVPILTARPTAEEEALVPHRLYGILEAHEQPSVGKWLRFAKMEIDWTLSEGLLPIIVGGTGMYIKALIRGIAEIPDIDPLVRQQAANDYEAMGQDAFSERLKLVDPQFFERLKVVDRQRLLRAYEVWLGTGRPLSFWQQQKTGALYPDSEYEVIKVELPREELYARCDARFEKMVEQGAVQQLEAILPSLAADSTLRKVIGVSELAEAIEGRQSIDQSVKQAQQATRNYAKRQLTWLRHQL
ncbi:MAG: tRNA (adenosine(37)-N6)-dimethylallyltransferase MiaA [Alphaproteobacteria bacterium]